MTGYEFGSVLLVPFPFTNQTGGKQRPAVSIASQRYLRERPDLILMPITSQNPGSTRFGDVPVIDPAIAGLLLPGVIKPIVFTMETRLVRKHLGRLSGEDQRSLRHTLALMLG